MKQKYIDECKIIHQNCTYTAEAHHQMALSEKKKSLWLEIIPAICAALTSTLVVAGYAKNDLLILTIISSVIVAVAGVLNPSKSYQSHLGAAKDFTSLKHDARFLHEAGATKFSDEAFIISVEKLHEKYNDLIKTVPPTNKESFKKAQNIVQANTHEPDRNEDGSIK